MKPLLEQRPITTNFDSEEFKIAMGREQIAHFTRLLVTHQYEHPLTASIREVVSNAYDANLETKAKTGTMPKVVVNVLEDRIEVRDYGPGLSNEQMFNLYSIIGHSTKHNNEDQIGAYGIGRLAPLSLSKQFFVNSYYDGTMTLYCVYLNDEHIPSVSAWESEPTTEANGLKISIVCPRKKDMREHVAEMLVSALHVCEGSRYPVEVNESVCGFKYNRLEDHKYISVESDAFAADFYLCHRVDSNEYTGLSKLESYLDLGGVLYKANGNGFKNKMNSFQGWNNRATDRLESVLGNVSKPIEKVSAVGTDSLHEYGTLIIRLKPNAFQLSTSREAIVSSEEQQVKLSHIYNEAHSAVADVYLAKLNAALDAKYKALLPDGADLKDKTKAASQAMLDVWLHTPDILDNINELTIHNESGYVFHCHREPANYNKRRYINVEVTEKDIHLTFSSDYPNHLNVNFFVLRDKELDESSSESERYLKNAFGNGVNKLHPYKETHISYKELLAYDWQVVISYNSMVTQKQLAKEFGEDVLKRPVLVLKIKASDSNVIQQLEANAAVINYLGVYTEPEVVKKKKQQNSTNKEVSILLRQLNHGSALMGLPTLGVRSLRAVDSSFTKELLQEKVIYYICDDVVNSKGDKHIRTSYPACIITDDTPKYYLKEYHPMILTVSDSAGTRIKKLVEEGECNWISAKDVAIDILNEMVITHGNLIELIGHRREAAIVKMVAESKLARYLPKPTYHAGRWPDHLKEACFSIRTGYETYPTKPSYKNSIGSIVNIKYGRYLNSVNNELNLYGTHLEPYHSLLYWLAHGLDDDEKLKEQVLEDLHNSFQAQSITPYW